MGRGKGHLRYTLLGLAFLTLIATPLRSKNRAVRERALSADHAAVPCACTRAACCSSSGCIGIKASRDHDQLKRHGPGRIVQTQ
jgi:hypothetical protein